MMTNLATRDHLTELADVHCGHAGERALLDILTADDGDLIDLSSTTLLLAQSVVADLYHLVAHDDDAAEAALQYADERIEAELDTRRDAYERQHPIWPERDV